MKRRPSDSPGERFRRFLENALPQINAQIRSRVRSQDAPDLVHEVVLTALQRKDSFDPHYCAVESEEGNFRRWVAGITRRIRYTYLTRRQRNRLLLANAVDHLLAEAAPQLGNLSKLEAEETITAIQEALKNCSSKLRDVAVRFFRGMSIDEIAAELGVSKDAVQQRKSRIKQVLRNAIGELSDPDLQLIVYASDGRFVEEIDHAARCQPVTSGDDSKELGWTKTCPHLDATIRGRLEKVAQRIENFKDQLEPSDKEYVDDQFRQWKEAVMHNPPDWRIANRHLKRINEVIPGTQS